MSRDSWGGGSWAQSWVNSVTSRKFRNFAMPRSSLLKGLQSTPRSLNADSDYVPPAEGKSQLFPHNAPYNAPFDNIQFATSKAANLRQVPGDVTSSPYGPAFMADNASDSPSGTDRSSYSSGMRFSARGPRGKLFGVFSVMLKVFAFLAVVAIITVAVYYKLSSGKESDDPNPGGYATAMALKLTNQNFSPQLLSKSSREFEAFENMFCSNMSTLYSGQSKLGSYKGCSVDQVRNGSALAVDFTLFFLTSKKPIGTDLVTSLTTGSRSSGGTITLATGLGIRVNSVQILRVSEVPGDRFIGPNIPVSMTTTMSPSSSDGHSGLNSTDSSTPASTDNSTNSPNSTDNSTNSPNSTVNSTDSSNSTVNSTDSSNSTVNSTDSSNSTVNSTDSSNSTDNSTDSPNSNVNSTDSSNSTVNSTDSSNSTVNSTDSSNSTVNSTDSSNSTVNSTDSSNSTVNSTDSSNSTFNSTDSSNSTDNSTDSSNSTVNSTDSSNSTFNSTDSSNSTDNSTDSSNSTVNSTDSSNSTDNSTDSSNSTFNSTDSSNSTVNSTDSSNSTFNSTDSSNSTVNSTNSPNSTDNSTTLHTSSEAPGNCSTSTADSNSTTHSTAGCSNSTEYNFSASNFTMSDNSTSTHGSNSTTSTAAPGGG